MADLSMVASADLIAQAFVILGPERLLFGSDEPFNLLRYVVYEHPKLGRRYISTYPYHWLDDKQREEYGHLARDAIHVHWQVLLAIREEISTLYPSNENEVKELVFYKNAKRILNLRFDSPHSEDL